MIVTVKVEEKDFTHQRPVAAALDRATNVPAGTEDWHASDTLAWRSGFKFWEQQKQEYVWVERSPHYPLPEDVKHLVAKGEPFEFEMEVGPEVAPFHGKARIGGPQSSV